MSDTENVENGIKICQIQQLEDTEQEEIAASSIRSAIVELEQRVSTALQGLENTKSVPPTLETENPTGSSGSGQRARYAPQSSLLDEPIPTMDVFTVIEQLISYSESEEDPEYPLPALDNVSQLAIMSASIIAYLSHLDQVKLSRFVKTIAGDTTNWLCDLFKFRNAAMSFHLDNIDPLLRAARLAIVLRCPGYIEGGVTEIAEPCFYMSQNLSPLLLQHVCAQLGIPMTAIRRIPATGPSGTTDMNVLQKIIRLDVAAKRTPVLYVGDVGGSACGHVDNLLALRDICQTHNIWLHVNGHGLAALPLPLTAASIGDIVSSMTVNLSSWIGVPSLPIVLLHRPVQNAALSAYDSDPILSRRLNSLSLWCSLQAMGRRNISDRLHLAFQSCISLHDIVSNCSGISVLSYYDKTDKAQNFEELLKVPGADFQTFFNTMPSAVVFQFDGSEKNETDSKESEAITMEPSTVLEKKTRTSYLDRLNLWLGQILQRDCAGLCFEVIEHPTCGSCIRYCPLEQSYGEQEPRAEHLTIFGQYLFAHVDILRATMRHKAMFVQLVQRNPELRVVNLPDWAGMGGVRYVPEGWEQLLTDQAKTELNKLNVNLVDALKSTDTAFSMGESADGFICVRFGMVTHETDIQELLELVVAMGKRVQENARVLETMSEIVKKGIEAAIADLQRETEEKIWQDGILRHVPVVGRVFNWWSPPVNETGIKGRSLKLTQGVVESTENIYKYHMQMAGSSKQLPGNRSPPTPMVQTSIVSAANNSANAPAFPTVEPATEQTAKPGDGAKSIPEIEERVKVRHTRTASQSSGVSSSSVPELVTADNAESNNNNNNNNSIG